MLKSLWESLSSKAQLLGCVFDTPDRDSQPIFNIGKKRETNKKYIFLSSKTISPATGQTNRPTDTERHRPLADAPERQRIQAERDSNKDTGENIYTTEKIYTYTDNREKRQRKKTTEKKRKRERNENKYIFPNSYTQHPPFSHTYFPPSFSVEHPIYFNLQDVNFFNKKKKKSTVQAGLWGWC